MRAQQRIRHPSARVRWLTRGVVAIGLASFFSDLGHEMTTALLPLFLVSVLGAPALALGVVEGTADGASALFKFAGGYVSDATAGTAQRRRVFGASGYLLTAVATSLIGLASTWPVVIIFRSLAWMGRGFRSPIRNAVLAEQIEPSVYGRAFGFERAMDSVGAIAGPLLAAGLLVTISIRPALLLAGVPGLVAVVCFLVVREARRQPHPAQAPQGVRARLAALPNVFRGFLLSAGLFGVGNFAATFLLLRATLLLTGAYGAGHGAALALGLYTLYNVVYALSAYVAGEIADRAPKRLVLLVGYGLFLVVCVGFVWVGANLLALALLFAVAGAQIGCVETAETAYAAELLPATLRGTGFGALAAINGIGDTLSSVIVGILWTVVAPAAGFAFGALFAVIGVGVLALTRPPVQQPQPSSPSSGLH